jgi:hypothetical protein
VQEVLEVRAVKSLMTDVLVVSIASAPTGLGNDAVAVNFRSTEPEARPSETAKAVGSRS